MESWTVFESSFIEEETSKLLVKISSTTLPCLDRCCCEGSSCLLTWLVFRFTLSWTTSCESAQPAFSRE